MLNSCSSKPGVKVLPRTPSPSPDPHLRWMGPVHFMNIPYTEEDSILDIKSRVEYFHHKGFHCERKKKKRTTDWPTLSSPFDNSISLHKQNVICGKTWGCIQDSFFSDLNRTQCEDAGYMSLNATWCLKITNDSESWFVARQRCEAINAQMLEIRWEQSLISPSVFSLILSFCYFVLCESLSF